MTLNVLDMPDDPDALPAWLEEQLLGTQLGPCAAELAALHGPAAAQSLDEWLAGTRDAVLEQGLSATSLAQRQALLQQPALLFPLQELVLVEGGPHWQQHADDAAAAALIGRTWERLQVELPSHPPAVERPAPPTRDRRWFALAAVAAAALLVLLGLQLFRPPPAPAPGWGWQRHESASADEPAAEYLQRLAAGAKAWFNKRPESQRDLVLRIAELRQGCSALLLADHRPLNDADRRWLLERCRRFADRLDAHLADVEDRRGAAEVRAAVDDDVNSIVDDLQQRARQAAARNPD